MAIIANGPPATGDLFTWYVPIDGNADHVKETEPGAPPTTSPDAAGVTQTPPTLLWPGAQHAPAMQLVPPPQTLPQAPQFAESDASELHAAPHIVRPAVHTHPLLEHTLPPGHA